MVYARIKTSQFFDLIKTEVEARDWIWRSRFGGKDFVCPEAFNTSSLWYFDFGPGRLIRGIIDPFNIFIACLRLRSQTRQNSSKIRPFDFLVLFL